MLSNIAKYTVLTLIVGILVFLGGIYIWSFAFASSEPISLSKSQIEQVFEVQLPAYTIDSLWGHESFTRDLSEYQELRFNPANQQDWRTFLNNTRKRVNEPQRQVDIQIIPKCNVGEIMGFNGGYRFDCSDSGIDTSLLIDTVIYKGYLWHRRY